MDELEKVHLDRLGFGSPSPEDPCGLPTRVQVVQELKLMTDEPGGVGQPGRRRMIAFVGDAGATPATHIARSYAQSVALCVTARTHD